MKKKLKLLFALGMVVAASALLGWWWNLAQTRQTVLEALPEQPAFDPSQRELQAAYDSAIARAYHLRESRVGLGELAQLYHANGYVEEALLCYQVLEELEPAEARWSHLRAVVLAGYGDLEPSIALWERVIRMVPDYLPAQLRLADSILKSNRPDEAAVIYARILERWPDQSYAILGLARIDFEAERWESARRRLEHLVEQTDYALGYDLIVNVYQRLGLQAEAEAVRGRMKASGAFREAPDPWVDELVDVCFDPYRIATVAGLTSDPERARHLLLRAIRLAPTEVSYRLQMASFLVDQGDITEAVKALNTLTQMAPNFADGWARLSSLYWLQGSHDAAVDVLLTGLAYNPDSPSLRLMRGTTLRLEGRLQEAVRELRASIVLRPNEAAAYVELSQTYLALGQVERAVAELRRAVEAEPGNAKALASLAFHAISTRNKAEADRWMAQVARQPRIDAEQTSFLSDAYHRAFGLKWQAAGG